jgi:polysaccharide export outer membrane protein
MSKLIFIILILFNQAHNYKIDIGDVLSIIVTPAEEVSKEVTVAQDGTISIMYVGAIRVKGLTIQEVKELIEEKLKKYVTSPKVTVTLKSFGYRKVFLTGYVSHPGDYNYKEGMKLLELISLAGGFTEKANTKEIRITRSGQVTFVNAEELKQKGEDFLLLPNDFIEVSRIKGEIFVYGEVKSAGVYEFKENFSLLELISRAGGFTDNANINKVKVVRKGKVIEININKIFDGDLTQNIVLEPGDIVIVPRSGISTWNWILSNVVPTLSLITSILLIYSYYFKK